MTNKENLDDSNQKQLVELKRIICRSVLKEVNQFTSYEQIVFEVLGHPLVTIKSDEKQPENEIVGYELIKEYPNSKNIGFIHRNVSMFFFYSQSPEYFKPVYKEVEKTLESELNDIVGKYVAIETAKKITKSTLELFEKHKNK